MHLRPQRILDYREFPVLYVDDEPENLRIFELTFRREFTVITADSGDAAMEILNKRPVAIVLSDQRMPGMSGVELLARVQALDAKVMRILVTAYGDAETLGRAVNDSSIYRYVPKPWDPDELRLALRRAIEVYSLDREREELLHELGILNRISHSINQQLDLEPLLDLLLATVTEDLGFDAATVYFLEEKGGRLGSARTMPNSGELADWIRRFSLTVDEAPAFHKHLQQGELQLLSTDPSTQCEPPVQNWLLEIAAEEVLVVPLVGKHGAVGALAIDNRRGGKRFDVSDRTLLEGLGVQAAIAIENARLVDNLRRSQEQVIRADRLGTLGTLAAGLAHEINNPLVSIHTFLSLVPSKRHEDDAEFWTDYHEIATAEVERIRRLVATMARLGRRSAEEPAREHCDLAAIAQAVIRLLVREAEAKRVSLDLDCDVDLPDVVGSRDQLHQVLLNLILNAIEASPPGGRVQVRARIDRRDSGKGVAVEVSDQGSGIAADDLEAIFDPFFTRKEPDQGTGLGLTICHQIVSDHEGSIEVQSREGEGTTFWVRVPAEPAL